MKASEEANDVSVPNVPVLKMPPDLALPTLRILAAHPTAEVRRDALTALRPGIPLRTLLNAYVLPSLSELGLYRGTLRAGDVTRYGRAIAEAKEPAAHALLARRLVELDAERVGLVEWLAERQVKGEKKRLALRRFIDERLGVPEAGVSKTLDRLGKWSAYLIHFGVMRESHTNHGIVWTVSRRHVDALRVVELGGGPPRRRLKVAEERDALLEAYARAGQQLGTRLYVPIVVVRDELGKEFTPLVGTLLDAELDEVLRRAPDLLKGYVVSFSPFSGPAREGLRLEGMYAGYISVRPRSADSESNHGSKKDK